MSALRRLTSEGARRGGSPGCNAGQPALPCIASPDHGAHRLAGGADHRRRGQGNSARCGGRTRVLEAAAAGAGLSTLKPIGDGFPSARLPSLQRMTVIHAPGASSPGAPACFSPTVQRCRQRRRLFGPTVLRAGQITIALCKRPCRAVLRPGLKLMYCTTT